MIIIHLGPAVLPMPHKLGGAIQRRMLEIATLQAARGERVILYSAGNHAARTEHHGVEIRTLACSRSGSLRDLEYLAKARHDLRRQKVDVLHFHGLAEGAALLDRVAGSKLLSYDYFVFRRGKSTPLFLWYRNALRKFSCLLPVSEYCRQGSQAYWDFNGVPVRVLHNGVNLEQFCPNPAAGLARKHALGIKDEKVILYVGRVCEQKGTDVLVDAYLQAKQRYPRVRLVVAGPAAEFGRATGSELTRRVSEGGGLYLGAVEERELASIYNLADIFVMPTRAIEMFGMAAVEAQACGKPVVASRHGGLPEVISEQSGLFFPTGDAAALAAQLSRLLTDSELYRSLAEHARQNAERFAWPKIVEQLEAICSQS